MWKTNSPGSIQLLNTKHINSSAHALDRSEQAPPQRSHSFSNIVGNSLALRRVLDLVEKVAASDSTVLITGESGTGKELIARAIHERSRRANENLVAVNCGAVPEELLESELFGHVRGAFTNAVSNRDGRFAAADSGTLFLDEIGDMQPNLQIKLLRVLQERSFEPVGSSKTRNVDVRVIAATNQNLDEAIREKRFREDLYYRLHVIPIELPSLRERRDDIPALLYHFLERARAAGRSRLEGISRDALELLCNYAWPGNVRELENLVERLVVMREDGLIRTEDLPAPIRAETSLDVGAPRLPLKGLCFSEEVNRFESELILQALEHTRWNKQRAAQLLGMNRTTLMDKIKRKGLVSDPGLTLGTRRTNPEILTPAAAH